MPVGAGWDVAAPSFVDTDVESIAVRRFGKYMALIAGSDLAPGLIDARVDTFEAVYSAHHRDVYRHVILTTRGRDDVEEIVAETFARAFAAWRSGQGPAGRPLPWLLVIARRIATDRWRRRRLMAWLPLPDNLRPSRGDWDRNQAAQAEPGGPDRAAGVAEFWLWLDALSQALPTRQRDVIFLRYQRDLSDEDIGEILGLSASGVRTLASRALSGLRNHPELWS
jgi:RNA polymerase sigma-70 factor, ECF subfamily